MRKILLLLLIAGLGISAYLFYHQQGHQKNAGDVDTRIKDEDNAAEEDGIMLAQKQEFEMTKDIKLGYIPKDRLINAYQDLMKLRKSGPGARIKNTTGIISPAPGTPPSPITGLVWQERGSNSDATGPSNGNTRPGNGVTSGRMRAIWVDLSDATHKTVWVGSMAVSGKQMISLLPRPPGTSSMISLAIWPLQPSVRTRRIRILCTSERERKHLM